jgi:hypothetical protein
MQAGLKNEGREFFVGQVKDFEPFVKALRETDGKGFKNESAYAGISIKLSLLLYSLVELWVDRGHGYGDAFVKGAMCFTSGIKWMTGPTYLYHVYSFLEAHGEFLCKYAYPDGYGEAYFKKLWSVNDDDAEFERVFGEIDSEALQLRLHHWFYSDNRELTDYLGTCSDETLQETMAELFRKN